MSLPRFIDEINRLFDELVHDPWGQPLRPRPRGWGTGESIGWEAEIPLPGAGQNDLALTIEGRNLVVAVRRRTARTSHAGETTAVEGELMRHSFLLPEHAEVGSVEARFEDHVLRIRVSLRQR